MKITLDLQTLSKKSLRTLNSICRRNHAWRVTELVVDSDQYEPVKLDHHTYGVSTPRGKFFAGMTWGWPRDTYQHAECRVSLSVTEARRMLGEVMGVVL